MSLKRTGVARDIKGRTSGDMEENRWRMRSGHEAEGVLHHLGQLLSRTLAPFLFLLSGKKLFPGVSVELTEYCIK